MQPDIDNVFLDFIQEHASIGTWEFNLELATLDWSSETKNIHDVPLDFAPNVETGINFYKEGFSRNTIKNLFSQCLDEHKSFDTDLQIITAKGNEKWVRAIGKPIIKNNTCIKIIGLFQDIDEKTKRIKALALKREILNKTFDDALIGMATLGLNGKWIDVNKSLCKTLGYKKKELLKLTFIDITHPDDAKIGHKAIKEMIKGELDHFKIEKRYVTKKGKILNCLLSSSIIRDKTGIPLHFVAQINDVTQIKKSTEKIENLLGTSENQNKRLLNFAHIVSHNLRSHSGNLGMLLDIIKTDMPENTENEIFPLLELAVSQLEETVDNLNEVATINVKKDIVTEPLNLVESFEKAFATINAQIIESNTKVCLDVSPHIYVKAVPAYLDSILLNFLTNAIKYKKPSEPPKIELKASIKKTYVVLEIKDNGLGIDLNRHGKKLFGMYKTFHKHKDSRGIGLFITKNQVESLGGKIKVKSKVGSGTTFYIYLKHYENN